MVGQRKTTLDQRLVFACLCLDALMYYAMFAWLPRGYNEGKINGVPSIWSDVEVAFNWYYYRITMSMKSPVIS